MMAKFTVIVEPDGDGRWSAYSTTPSVVGGLGATRDEAIDDWKEAMRHWLAYMKETGEEVVLPEVELIQVEVAA